MSAAPQKPSDPRLPPERWAASLAKSVRLARWSFRKLQLPIRKGDLVLDVGSGASPHPRADVLLERYVSGQHRHGASVVADRPIVFADACRMPFKDKAFDYVIAFHVLEHVTNPEVFLSELMRVAKAGYIETPNVVFERFVPYDVHCLEIMNLNGRLMIHKKSAPASDPVMAKLKVVPQSTMWNEFFYGNPEYFHVRYHWRDRIDFEVTNPEESCAWYMQGANEDPQDVDTETAASGPRASALVALRKFYAFQNPKVDLMPILVCPDCRTSLADEGSKLSCPRCGKRYSNQPWPLFTETAT